MPRKCFLQKYSQYTTVTFTTYLHFINILRKLYISYSHRCLSSDFTMITTEKFGHCQFTFELELMLFHFGLGEVFQFDISAELNMPLLTPII
jgi:hypothetical protein